MKKLILRKKQVLFFILAGGASALVEVCGMKLFSLYLPIAFPQEENWFGIAYPISNILSTISAVVFNYGLSIWFVFKRGKHSKRREFAYFMSLSFFTTALSLLLFQSLYHFIFLSHLDFGFFSLSRVILSKSLAIVFVSILNYSVKKRIIFNT